MPRAKRICAKSGCPHPASGRYCQTHNAEYEAKRGTKLQRGYDAAFFRERKAWVPRVLAGGVICWRCNEPIQVGAPFDLGHSDDRTHIKGPEHPRCNRSAAGKSAHN